MMMMMMIHSIDETSVLIPAPRGKNFGVWRSSTKKARVVVVADARSD
jgi:hypothetical protein